MTNKPVGIYFAIKITYIHSFVRIYVHTYITYGENHNKNKTIYKIFMRFTFPCQPFCKIGIKTKN